MTINHINSTELLVISKTFRHRCGRVLPASVCKPPLTSAVMMVSCLSGCGAVCKDFWVTESGIVIKNVGCSHRTDGERKQLTAPAMATFSVKEVSGKNRKNQLALDWEKFITFISDRLITEEQCADNYIRNN